MDKNLTKYRVTWNNEHEDVMAKNEKKAIKLSKYKNDKDVTAIPLKDNTFVFDWVNGCHFEYIEPEDLPPDADYYKFEDNYYYAVWRNYEDNNREKYVLTPVFRTENIDVDSKKMYRAVSWPTLKILAFDASLEKMQKLDRVLAFGFLGALIFAIYLFSQSF